MATDIRELQNAKIKEISMLNSQRSYLEAIKEADSLLQIIGEPCNSADTVQYSFENQKEFIQYVALHKDEKAKQVVWTTAQTSHVLAEKAFALYELKRNNEAVISLIKAIKSNPINTHYKFELIENLLQLKNYNAAEKVLRLLIEEVIYPNDVARMYRRFGFYYTETKRYDIALACYVWSTRFEESDGAVNELLYIQSLRTGNSDPKYLENTIPQISNPKTTMDNLHSERLLLFFFNARKDFILSAATPELTEAAKLYQSIGLIRNDTPQSGQRADDSATALKETRRDSLEDFLNKYKK